MVGSSYSRKVVWGIMLCCLVLGVVALSFVPIARIPTKDTIGKVDIDGAVSSLRACVIPPKGLTSITLCLSGEIEESDNYCKSPSFPLTVGIRIKDQKGGVIIDELISQDQMQWTSWHDSPSLLVMGGGTLRGLLESETEYVFELTINSLTSNIGQADVYLHWFDTAYLCSIERHQLTLISSETHNGVPIQRIPVPPKPTCQHLQN